MLYRTYFRLRHGLLGKTTDPAVMRVNGATARRMPDLGLPRMAAEARAAFRAVLDHERPTSNLSVSDVLQFAEARGFVVHPSDWVPYSLGDDQYPQRYEPWAAWLAEKGYTPFWKGVRLTAGNWHRWSNEQREDAFAVLLRRDRSLAHELLVTLGSAEPARIRRGLLSRFDAGSAFSGMQSKDVEVLHHFLRDRDTDVRDFAKRKLDNLVGLQSEEANAAKVAQYFQTTDDGRVALSHRIYASKDKHYLAHTTFDVLAEVLGLRPEDLAAQLRLSEIIDELRSLILTTANARCRAIVAERLVAAGKTDLRGFFEAADPETREKGLRLTFDSVYPSTTFDFLGPDAGTLELADIRLIDNGRMKGSVERERRTGQLPDNPRDDPLRRLALLAGKAAAQALLAEALALGVDPRSPRLTMLRLNLAL